MPRSYVVEAGGRKYRRNRRHIRRATDNANKDARCSFRRTYEGGQDEEEIQSSILKHESLRQKYQHWKTVIRNINTAIGNVPIGSYLGYQFFDENNEEIQFVFDRRQENIRSESDVLKYVKPFPSLPVGAIDNIPFVPPENLTPEEVRVLSSITLTLERAQELFDKTVGQSLLPEWFEARKKRLTASNVGAVLHRKKKPTESFLQSIFDPKDLSNVESIRHGRQNGLKAQAIYACEMQKKNRKFTVFEAGLAVNPSLPFLGATPDAKVFDPTEK
ncbi:uncharacterized protein LOC116303857 [Actinia tenebrosa]|uniref:Uncharacterized protein LOC116303857 n=1 Tax=Actinia tenebrosa TaxID=6105 RepID=A0A6P8ISW4_ACTTE|nr:uncharacterized protein LOC116303857 [Actinia tenebrosa]